MKDVPQISESTSSSPQADAGRAGLATATSGAADTAGAVADWAAGGETVGGVGVGIAQNYARPPRHWVQWQRPARRNIAVDFYFTLLMSMPTALSPQELEKQQAAAAAVRWVRDGMLLGLGTGTTSAHFIKQLGERVQAGLKVQGTATSLASEALAREVGIPLIEPRRGLTFDLAVDGADELDAQLRLIKGGGGALLREKTIETASRYLLVIADSSKVVPVLGRFPLPLEVVPFSLPWVLDAVEKLGGAPVLRMHKDAPASPLYSDQRNFLVDCHFDQIPDAEGLARQLKTIPGIVEHGLFIDLAKAAVVIQSGVAQVLKPGEVARPATEFTELP
jgi:ribose 5-phosphate isomerase A